MADDLSSYGTVDSPADDLSNYGIVTAAPPHVQVAPSVLPRVGQRLAPPGTRLRQQQNKEAAQLPLEQQPGARMAKELTGAIPLVTGAVAAAALGPEAGPIASTATAALGAGVGSLVKQGYEKASGMDQSPATVGGVAKETGYDALTQGALPEVGGRIVGGATRLAGRGIGKLAGKIANAYPETAAGDIASRISNRLSPRVDPVPLFHQALAPVPNDLDFPEDSARAAGLIKVAANASGRGIGNNAVRPGDVFRDVQIASKIAKQGAFSRWQFAAGPYLDFQASADPVADQLESLITPGMRKENPARVQQILQEAAKYRGQHYTVEEAAERAAAHNAELRAFYKAPDDATRAQMTATADPIITKAEADGYRQMIYQPFNDAIQTARTPAELQAARQRLLAAQEARKDYGAIDSFLENVERRINPASREQPPSLLGQILQGGRAAVQAKTGDLRGAHGTINSLGNNNIDAVLKRAFDAVEERTPEVTANLPYPRPSINNPSPQKLLTAPPIQMPGIQNPTPGWNSGLPPITYRGQAQINARPFERLSTPTRISPAAIPAPKSAEESAAIFQAAPTYAELFDKADRRYAQPPQVPSTGPAEWISRVQDARERTAQTLAHKSWSELSSSERNTIDALISEGQGFSAQPLSPLPSLENQQ